MTKDSWFISLFLALSVGALVGHWASIKTIEEQAAQKPTVPVVDEAAPTSTLPADFSNLVQWQVNGNVYQAELVYDTPAGMETNQLSLTMEDGLITAYEMTIDTTNDTSISYQEDFLAELDSIIVGRQVSELANVDTLGGATVTTEAFTNALRQLPS